VNLSNNYGTVDSDDEWFDGYGNMRGRRNCNQNKAKPEANSTKRTNKANKASTNGASQDPKKRTTNGDKTSVSEKNSRGDKIKNSTAKKATRDGRAPAPAPKPSPIKSETFPEQEIGFQSASQELQQPKNPQIPRPIRNPHRYDTREFNGNHEWDPLKKRVIPPEARPFDYELKPTMSTRERHREHIPKKQKASLNEYNENAYRVRTPPWGIDSSNPNWEWEMARSARERFDDESHQVSYSPKQQQHQHQHPHHQDFRAEKAGNPDIYLLREDLDTQKRMNRGRLNNDKAAEDSFDYEAAAPADERQPRSQMRTHAAESQNHNGGGGSGKWGE